MRLLVAGGGTGGHIFPGLSVAKCLQKKFPDSEVTFIGSEKPIDREVVTQAGFSFISTPQIPSPASVFSFQGMRFALNSIFTFARAFGLVRHLKPDGVLGLGGYSSVAPVLAARILRIPALLFEANLQPGRANLFLARFVPTVAVGFGVNAGFFRRNRVVVTGIPVRESILSSAQKQNDSHDARRSTLDAFTLLVMGGSAGAQALNRLTASAFPKMKKKIPGLKLIHLTGKQEFDEMKKRYRGISVNGEVELYPFVTAMEQVLGRADAVVARSGASSLAEFALFGLPALLVPYPHSTEEHQVRNAEFFQEKGAAKMILEKDLTPEILAASVEELVWNPDRRIRMREAARRLGNADASEKIVDLLMEIASLPPKDGSVRCLADTSFARNDKISMSLRGARSATKQSQ